MRDAILFDLDGTLWDSVRGVVAAWNEVLAQQPDTDVRITEAQLQGYMGKTVQEIARLLLPALPESRALAIMAACAEREHAYLLTHGGSRLYDGLCETLEILRRSYDLCIISNCESGYIETFMTLYHTRPFFHDHTCSGDTGMTKGENIGLILSRNHYRRAFYVGDTAGDEQAARRAGIPFVYAAYGFGRAEAPDYTLQSFPDLPCLAERIFAKMSQ